MRIQETTSHERALLSGGKPPFSGLLCSAGTALTRAHTIFAIYVDDRVHGLCLPNVQLLSVGHQSKPTGLHAPSRATARAACRRGACRLLQENSCDISEGRADYARPSSLWHLWRHSCERSLLCVVSGWVDWQFRSACLRFKLLICHTAARVCPGADVPQRHTVRPATATATCCVCIHVRARALETMVTGCADLI